jgi:hypothetical protein
MLMKEKKSPPHACPRETFPRVVLQILTQIFAGTWAICRTGDTIRLVQIRSVEIHRGVLGCVIEMAKGKQVWRAAQYLEVPARQPA